MQTIFIISGIMIGVAVIVFMSAMLASMQQNFIKRILTSQPQVQLLVPEQIARPLRMQAPETETALIQRPTQRVLSIDQWPKIRDQMRAVEGVMVVSPSVSGSALAVRGNANRAISIVGMDPAVYYEIVKIPDYIVAGDAQIDTDDIIIGTELARDLGANTGDKLTVRAASGSSRILTIKGIVDLGNKGVNQRATFVMLRTAQSLLSLIGGVTTIDLRIDDVYAAETLAQQIQASIPIQADSWIKTNAQFFTAVHAQGTANTLIRLFVGLSVASGIAAVLVVSVIQRSKDIGILRAMGTSRSQVLRIFLIQGGLLALIGSLFGSALGGEAAILYHNYTRQADGSELFPLVLGPGLFVGSVLLATLTGVVAAIVPALRAAKLDPVVAIRG